MLEIIEIILLTVKLTILKLWVDPIFGIKTIIGLAGLELLYQRCLMSNHIFGKLGDKWRFLEEQTNELEAHILTSSVSSKQEYKLLRKMRNNLYLLYPLGACQYCNLIWLTILFLFTYEWIRTIWYILFFLGIVYTGLYIIQQIMNKLKQQ